MKQKSGPDKAPAERVVKDIRRQTRRQYSAELCRREGIAASMCYGWSKELTRRPERDARASRRAAARSAT